MFKEELESWYSATQKDLDAYIDEQEKLYMELFKEFNNLASKHKGRKSNSLAGYKLELKGLLAQRFESLSDIELEKVHYKWWDHCLSLASSLPVSVREEQLEDRFKGKGVSSSSKFLKPIKIVAFRLQKLPIRLFSKKKNKFWSHTIRAQSLFTHHFYEEFLPQLEKIDEAVLKTGIETAIEIKEWEENYYSEGYRESVDIDSSYKVLRKNVRKILKDYYTEKLKSFQDDLKLAGTIEYKNRILRESYLRDKILRNKKHWKSHYDGWTNVSFSIFEDWRSDLEVSSLAISVGDLMKEFDATVKDWLKEVREEHLSSVGSFLATESEKIQNVDNSKIKKEITSSRYRLKKELDAKMIIPLTEKLSKNSLLNMLDQLDYSIRQRIDNMNANYFVVKDGEKEGPLRSGDFASVSNYDLISFDIRPKLSTDFEEIKATLLQSINQWILQIGDLDEVITYSLNTAETILEEENSDPNQVILEGIERASKRLNDLSENMSIQVTEQVQKIDSILSEFCAEVSGLTDNDNVRQIQFRISKAKAIEKSDVLRKRAIWRVTSFWTRSKGMIKGIFLHITQLIQKVRGNIIPSDASEEKIRSVSDFVISSTEHVQTLPLIYRRLYAIDPLTDHFLFEGRTQEIDQIFNSYDSWAKGRYSSSLVIGEKWSGLTTLLNYILDQPKFNFQLIRIEARNWKRSDGMLLMIFNDVLKNTFADEEQLISYLNEGPKRIIVLEDLQSLFIRKIGGMREMRNFLKVMAATQKNIFWISSITLYAYKYLEKVSHLSGFFSYLVKLETLTDEEVKRVILKRNRISGYEIKYDIGELDQTDKKIKRLNESQKQQYLEQKFFKQLNGFAKSNISMALQFWLLSTRSIDQHSITISPFEIPDFSFLHHLPQDSIHILMALILHDGLSSDQLKDVLNESKDKIFMNLLEMEEDGLITSYDGKYLVNTLIYRPVVQLLLSKNLLRS